MPVRGPSPAADRGAALLRAVGLARATHRCLAVHGHVDDLLPTPDGRVLRLPELLAIDASGEGIMTVVASEARGATTRTPPDGPAPPRPVRLAPAPLAELLDQLLDQLAGQPSLLLLQGVHSAVEQDDAARRAAPGPAVRPPARGRRGTGLASFRGCRARGAAGRDRLGHLSASAAGSRRAPRRTRLLGPDRRARPRLGRPRRPGRRDRRP